MLSECGRLIASTSPSAIYHYHCPTLQSFMDLRFAFKPMSLVKYADEIMKSTEVLFRENHFLIRSDERVWVEDRILR